MIADLASLMVPRRRRVSRRSPMGPTLDILHVYESVIRLSAFFLVFAAMAVWELAAPKRRLSVGRGPRWPGNLGVVVLDSLIVRILFPTAAVGVALLCEARGWGLFNLVALPWGLATLLSVILLDLAIYRAACAVPRRAGAVAAAPHAPCGPRHRRDHGSAVPSRGDPAFAAHQVRGRHPHRCTGGCSADLRSPSQRDLDVQPQQRRDAAKRGSHRAHAGRDARHAPRAPFDLAAGDQQQLRLSISPGGTACSAPTGASRSRVTRA